MFKREYGVLLKDLAEMSDALSKREMGSLKGANVLVTGGTGLIGFYIVSLLVYLNDKHDLGLNVYCSTRNEVSARAYFSKFVDIDLVKFVLFGKESSFSPFDFIFHTASSTSPQDLLNTPLNVIKVNVNYTSDLLDLLTEKTGEFVLLSTREIYGKKVEKEKMLVEETDYGILDPMDVRSAYPESKRLAENMLVAQHKQYGNPYKVIRISHTYGPGIKLNDGRVLSDIIGAMVADSDIDLKSDGCHRISPTYVSDVVSGIFISCLFGESGAYNISNHSEIYSVFEIASLAVSNSVGTKVTRPYEDVSSHLYLKHDTGVLCSKKIQGLGWDFSVPLREGLVRTYKHYKA